MRSVRDPRYGIVLCFLIAEMAVDQYLFEPALQIVRRRGEAAATVLRRGIERGQLSTGTDIGLIIELVSGAILFHQFFGESDSDADYAARVSALVIAGGRRLSNTLADASTPAEADSNSDG